MCVCAPCILYEVRAWAGVWGWMVSFGIDLFYYVCARHAVHPLHTQKSNLSQAVAEHNAWKQLRLCRTQRSENKSCLSYMSFSFFFFFTSLWTFAPTTLKSILYLLGYKSFPWMQKVFFCECACRISDVRTFLYHLSHWFSAALVAYVLLNAGRVTEGIWS